ncbi:FtsK/SpoIIIE domain-containing protein [Bifidobacterium sp. ESL0763]|uniref:FtsK/SpoIIIE domain-containing protein n=1 Tax=Bifidobacterium sp. ESL0763 TaxID=2983227 RepID=UPI0023F7C986|nr:FtsK/SpoIIIE domain-containing protein [Bifidobacterium sp. ESL0763]MDF7663986.1 FtsK/SpoIIIE domain-containing protein [Bifidobacterium sp. ESL0763]
MAYASPFVSQAVMLAVMIVARQWLFVAILVPNLLATFASFLLFTLAGSDSQPAGETGADATGTATAIDDGESDDFSSLPAASFESLQGPDGGTAMPWRRIVCRWLAPPTLESQIGMGRDGVFTIDLRRQGPHALVAGTTGSGKSVFLQSWCMAMALANPPSRLNFVFMDFKGGSAFSGLAALPHTVGNVCDLNLRHAVRALLALEAELKRRERLVAEASAADVSGLDRPPPLLVIVIDEFHALKDQLPDYMDRLMSIASLGRSLGMHLIACTQNPLGQVTDGMKANMSLDICLRVRDGMQSHELLGGPQASRISPKAPGCAYRNDGEDVEPFRCAPIADIDALVAQVRLAARFMGEADAATLFTPPLPALAAAGRGDEGDCGSRQSDPERVPFGIADDGFTLSPALLPLDRGNIAVIGGPGKGKSTLLDQLAGRLRGAPGLMLQRTVREPAGFRTWTLHTRSPSRPAAGPTAPPAFPKKIWLVDDADDLMDPLAVDNDAQALRRAIADANCVVVFAVENTRHVRVPEQSLVRLVFPTGERPVDLMDGVPSSLLSTLGHDDFGTPGRAVLLEAAEARLVQCFAPQERHNRGPERK